MSLATWIQGYPRTCHSTLFTQVARRGLATQKKKTNRLATAIILNRSPILTRTPTPFEKAFYDYEARIQRVLHNPFPSEFYFKPGSVLEAKFNEEERQRERTMFGKGFGTSDKKPGYRPRDNSQEEEEQSLPRVSKADETNDVKSLDRQGERNLYLLVKTPPGGKYEWQFPQRSVETGEFLHRAARRYLNDECGTAMNTWLVGRRPIGHYEHASIEGQDSPQTLETIFFLKAHIFAGQVMPSGANVIDFAWLTKEEIEPYVNREYWLGTKDMLSDF